MVRVRARSELGWALWECDRHSVGHEGCGSHRSVVVAIISRPGVVGKRQDPVTSRSWGLESRYAREKPIWGLFLPKKFLPTSYVVLSLCLALHLPHMKSFSKLQNP